MYVHRKTLPNYLSFPHFIRHFLIYVSGTIQLKVIHFLATIYFLATQAFQLSTYLVIYFVYLQ